MECEVKGGKVWRQGVPAAGRNGAKGGRDDVVLRKNFTGSKWLFTEGRNPHNPASHCDIAWAGALATFAYTENTTSGVSAAVAHETGWFDGRQFHPYKS